MTSTFAAITAGDVPNTIIKIPIADSIALRIINKPR